MVVVNIATQYYMFYAIEPPNNGHIGDSINFGCFVLCVEVVKKNSYCLGLDAFVERFTIILLLCPYLRGSTIGGFTVHGFTIIKFVSWWYPKLMNSCM